MTICGNLIIFLGTYEHIFRETYFIGCMQQLIINAYTHVSIRHFQWRLRQQIFTRDIKLIPLHLFSRVPIYARVVTRLLQPFTGKILRCAEKKNEKRYKANDAIRSFAKSVELRFSVKADFRNAPHWHSI